MGGKEKGGGHFGLKRGERGENFYKKIGRGGGFKRRGNEKNSL